MVGVTDALQANFGLTYLAGVWKDSIPFGLLWYGIYKFVGHRSVSSIVLAKQRLAPLKIEEQGAATVPSWSWYRQPKYRSALIAHNIHFESRGRWESVQFDYLAKLEYFKWPDHPRNVLPDSALFDFSGLGLTFHTASFRTLLQLRPETPSNCSYQAMQCPSLQEAIQDTPSRFGAVKGMVINYYCDDINDEIEDAGNVLLALMIETHTDRVDNGTHFNGAMLEMYGLGLRPAEEAGTWTRHGYWTLHISYEMYIEVRGRGIPNYQAERHPDPSGNEDMNLENRQSELCPGKKETIRHQGCEDRTNSYFLHLPGVKITTLTLV